MLHYLLFSVIFNPQYWGKRTLIRLSTHFWHKLKSGVERELSVLSWVWSSSFCSLSVRLFVLWVSEWVWSGTQHKPLHISGRNILCYRETTYANLCPLRSFGRGQVSWDRTDCTVKYIQMIVWNEWLLWCFVHIPQISVPLLCLKLVCIHCLCLVCLVHFVNNTP